MSDIIAFKDSNNNYWDTEVENSTPIKPKSDDALNIMRHDMAHILAEADESDGSFLLLRPNNLIITSIDNDHLETYDGDFKKLKEAFKEFAMNVPFQGKIVCYGDNKELEKLIQNVPRNFINYGFKKTNDFQITDLRQSLEGCKFSLKNNLDNSLISSSE